MSEHPFADRAAEWLRASRESVGPRATSAPEPVIGAIADAIRAQARRRRARAAIAAGALALAAGAAAIWLVPGRAPAPTTVARQIPHPPAGDQRPAVAMVEPGAFTAVRAGSALFDAGAGTRAVAAGAAFTSGHTLSSGGEPATLTGADGTVIRVEPRTELALVRADSIRWFQLQRGTFEAHVAKLASGNRFVVATPDRQVEVRGTRFRVSLAPADAGCGNGTVTRVIVEEGVVTVRAPGGAEDRVTAGQQWPTDCSKVPHAPADRSRKPRPSTESADVRSPAPETVTPSTLGAENDLFGRAARAERAGDAAGALRLLDELLARYPSSPLHAAADAERQRLLDRTK